MSKQRAGESAVTLKRRALTALLIVAGIAVAGSADARGGGRGGHGGRGGRCGGSGDKGRQCQGSGQKKGQGQGQGMGNFIQGMVGGGGR